MWMCIESNRLFTVDIKFIFYSSYFIHYFLSTTFVEKNERSNIIHFD